MCKQCQPGPFSPPLLEPGNKAGPISHLIPHQYLHSCEVASMDRSECSFCLMMPYNTCWGTTPTIFYVSKLCSVKMANSNVHVKTSVLCMANHCLHVQAALFLSTAACPLVASALAASPWLHPLQLLLQLHLLQLPLLLTKVQMSHFTSLVPPPKHCTSVTHTSEEHINNNWINKV